MEEIKPLSMCVTGVGTFEEFENIEEFEEFEEFRNN